MQIKKQIIFSNTAPNSAHVLWLNSKNLKLYTFNNGWVPLATSEGGEGESSSIELRVQDVENSHTLEVSYDNGVTWESLLTVNDSVDIYDTLVNNYSYVGTESQLFESMAALPDIQNNMTTINNDLSNLKDETTAIREVRMMCALDFTTNKLKNLTREFSLKTLLTPLLHDLLVNIETFGNKALPNITCRVNTVLDDGNYETPIFSAKANLAVNMEAQFSGDSISGFTAYMCLSMPEIQNPNFPKLYKLFVEFTLPEVMSITTDPDTLYSILKDKNIPDEF